MYCIMNIEEVLFRTLNEIVLLSELHATLSQEQVPPSSKQLTRGFQNSLRM